jgi:hypothetical protein
MDFVRIAWKIRMEKPPAFCFLDRLGVRRSTAHPVYANWNPSSAKKLHGRGVFFHNSY